MPIDHSVTWQKTAPTATLFAQVPYVALSSARGALRFASYVRSRALRGLEIDSHLTMLCSMVDELVSDRPHCKYAIGAKEEIGHCAELIEYLYAGTQFDRLFVNAFWRNLSRAIFNLSLVGGS